MQGKGHGELQTIQDSFENGLLLKYPSWKP